MDYKIEDCFTVIRNGANIKQGTVDGGFPITRIETISNDKFNRDRLGYAGITDSDKYSNHVLEDGDLLMSHINSPKYLGRTVVYHKNTDEVIIHGMNLLKLRVRKEIVIPDFVEYLFKSFGFRNQIAKIMKKSVNQASFSTTDLKKIILNIPSLTEQNEIVNKLYKVKSILTCKNTQLGLLDDLVKSRFVEMFGNELDSSSKALVEVCTKITDGTHQSPEFLLDGIPFIFISNIKNYRINLDTEKYISLKTYNELTKNNPIDEGDVLLTIVGSYGNPAVVEDEKKFCFQRHIAHLKLNKEILNSYYLHTALRIPYVREQIDRRVKGIAQKTLNLSELKKVMVNIPSLNKQNDFMIFLKQIDKLKVEVQKSLDETQVLFDSLMQEYFE